jgi:hypothetical protein
LATSVQYRVERASSAALLARAHAAGDHRVDDFQVRGIERQRQVHRPARGGDVGAETHVVLDVAGVGAIGRRMVELALELVEQLARRLAEGIDQHVEAAAVGHAYYGVLDPVAAGAAQHHVQQRHQAVAAFQREALLADVLGVQVAFQAFGRGQALEDPQLRFLRLAVVAGRGLELFIHPAALLGIGDVHELGADAAGIGRLEQRHQVGQLHALATGHAAGEEFATQVAVGQAVEGQGEVGRVGLGGHAQRVEVGAEVAARAVGGDQLSHGAIAVVAAARGRHGGAVGGAACGQRDFVDDRRVRHVAGFAAPEAVEIGLPFRPDAVGRDQILLVQALDVVGIGAELRGLGKLLQETVHYGAGKLIERGGGALQPGFKRLIPRWFPDIREDRHARP